MVTITSVVPQEDYKLYLTFSDGKKGVFDVESHLDRGIFLELRNPSLFKSVYIMDEFTIAWANGADLCPDCVYAETKFVN